MLTQSPLRYPGGKASLRNWIASTMRQNDLNWGHYFEPYAGGAGLALGLLFSGDVAEIHINDADPAIYAFWHSVLHKTDAFIERMHSTSVKVEEWEIQREIYHKGKKSKRLELGFSAFFLNRTNRSGVIRGAGCIGGRSQTGEYKIDCRFNKDDLEKRIRRIARYRSQISLYGLDAMEFFDIIDETDAERAFCYIDPPYYNKGQSLYANAYAPHHHADVASRILELEHAWLLTYDTADAIRKLYKSRRQFEFQLNYSANIKRKGGELLIASKGLRLPAEIKALPMKRVQYNNTHAA